MKSIFQASHENDTEAVEALLRENPELVKATDSESRWSPLHYAADQNSAEAAEVLIRHGADCNSRAQDGVTPLHLAAGVEIVERLLRHGGDPQLQDAEGKTPRDRAYQENSSKLFLALAATHPDAPSPTYQLLKAAQRGHRTVVATYEGHSHEFRVRQLGWTDAAERCFADAGLGCLAVAELSEPSFGSQYSPDAEPDPSEARGCISIIDPISAERPRRQALVLPPEIEESPKETPSPKTPPVGPVLLLAAGLLAAAVLVAPAFTQSPPAVSLPPPQTASPIEVTSSPTSPQVSVTPSIPSPVPVPAPVPSKPTKTTQAGGDARHTGLLPGPGPTSEPRILWVTALGAEVTTPVVGSPDGTQLFVGLENGDLCCLESSSGRFLWKYSTGKPMRNAPACHDDWVEVAVSGAVASLNRATGQKQWQAKLGSDVVGPLTEEDGVLFLASEEGSLTALQVGDGATRWTRKTGANSTAGVSVEGENVIVCCLDRTVRCFSKATGVPRWQTRLGGTGHTTPCVESGLITVGCDDHKVYNLRCSNGSLAWKRALPDEVLGAPVAMGGNLWVGCKDGNLYCLDRSSGRKVWHFPTGKSLAPDLVGSSDTIYGISRDLVLYAIGATDHKLRFQYQDIRGLQTPWVQDSVVYLPTTDGRLKALK